MKIDIMTLFPDMCSAVLNESIIGRAIAAGKIEVECTDIRPYTENKHGRVDDAPYGGGMGMVMAPQPIADCFAAICDKRGYRPHLIYMSPKGRTLTQKRALELSQTDGFAILCGHYEGVDQRVLDELVDEEISIGDYVLTGGELPALVLTDTVCRLVSGVLSDDTCFTEESHFSGLLEYPQYTRPPEWHGRRVPDILLSGHHANVERWRREQSLIETARKRPELLKCADVTESERDLVDNLLNQNGKMCK
jgi:tRNA (guanine37-N1)-methyltransferase